MDKFDRSTRRHHNSRLKANRSKSHWFWGDKTGKQLGMILHTAKLCSCHMCGNSRRFFGEITVQEKRQLSKFKSELDDISGS